MSSYEPGDNINILPVQMPICSCEETINEFEVLTRDARRVQQDALKKILELNADAEYLNHFGLGGRTDVQSYKSFIPLSVHSDLEPYIQRIVDGDSSPVLTGKPITSLSLRYSLLDNRVLLLCPLFYKRYMMLVTWFLLFLGPVLVQRRESPSSCHLTMNCLRPHFKYFRLLTHLGTGKECFRMLYLSKWYCYWICNIFTCPDGT
jgi:hypothetical protein